MESQQAIDLSRVRLWINHNYDKSKIESELAKLDFTEDLVAEYLKAFNKAKTEVRQFNGFIWMAVGAFLGFVSCVLSLWNPIPELFYPILFGPTPLSILMVCYGLYLVFE